MSHLVNANKLVSDTPISDSTPHNVAELGMLCRKLERELNAANSKIELLMSANADVARIADERDAAEKRIPLLIAERDTAQLRASQNWKIREEFRALLGTDDVSTALAVVRELKQRIKRLEEAGDLLTRMVCRQDGYGIYQDEEDAVNSWHKAKEAKP